MTWPPWWSLVGRWEQTAAFAAIGANRLSPAGDLVEGSGHPRRMRALLDSSTYTYFHQVGTCAMGPDDDPRRRARPAPARRGVDGLRVADAWPCRRSCAATPISAA
ncbi:MAG: GMC oxidoreductase [Acidimicrobiales bacterium]